MTGWIFRIDVRARRMFILVMLAAIAMGTLITLGAITLIREAPIWWRTVDPADPNTIEIAEAVERGVMNTVHRSRPQGEAWSVSVSAAEANAWLNVKLPKWATNRGVDWPESIGETQVEFADGRISFGALILSTQANQVVAATVRPVLSEDGALWITTATAQAGRLDIPSGWTVSRLRGWLPEEMRERVVTTTFLDALAGARPALQEPVLELGDGRRVRLIALRPIEGRLEITCITERAGADN